MSVLDIAERSELSLDELRRATESLRRRTYTDNVSGASHSLTITWRATV
jgi:hypothetical protein